MMENILNYFDFFGRRIFVTTQGGAPSFLRMEYLNFLSS